MRKRFDFCKNKKKVQAAASKKEKICIIGHFGGKKDVVNGQTIKTKELYDGLLRAGNWQIRRVDTYYSRRNPFRLIFQTMRGVFSCRKIVVLLSRNGMRLYFPFLCFASRRMRKDVYHDVIGGNLDKYVRNNKKMIKYLKSFKCNIVETETLKDNLMKIGIDNCVVLPNFKKLTIKRNNNKRLHDPLRLCTFSRVMEEKGISLAIEAVGKINASTNIGAILDIYGPIDDGYKEEFEKLLKNNCYAKYKGVIPYNSSVDILSNYDLLLFPTYWDSEGVPGTIIDAFAAGLPTIASDWNYNKDIINNYETGIIYPNGNENDLDKAILRAIKDKKEYARMSKKCAEEALKYLPENNIKIIMDLLFDDGR